MTRALVLLLLSACVSVRMPVVPVPRPPAFPEDRHVEIAMRVGMGSDVGAQLQGGSTWAHETTSLATMFGSFGGELALVTSIDEALDDFTPTGLLAAPIVRTSVGGLEVLASPRFVATSGRDELLDSVWEGTGFEVPVFATWRGAPDGPVRSHVSLGTYLRQLEVERTGGGQRFAWTRRSGGVCASTTIDVSIVAFTATVGFEHTLRYAPPAGMCPLGGACQPELAAKTDVLFDAGVGFSF